MRSYSLYFTFGKDGPPRYYVEVFQQPWYRLLYSTLYHWYDMHIFKVPGFKAFERWHSKRYCKDLTYTPISARQDEKCFFLDRKGKIVLAQCEVDSDTYDKLGGTIPT